MNNILKEIKKVNALTIKVFNYLYKYNDKNLNKTIYRITEINEILTNLEINIKMEIDKNDNRL